jgi:hypothetical protein
VANWLDFLSPFAPPHPPAPPTSRPRGAVGFGALLAGGASPGPAFGPTAFAALEEHARLCKGGGTFAAELGVVQAIEVLVRIMPDIERAEAVLAQVEAPAVRSR